MPDFNEPQSRNEAILQNCLGANNELGEPQSRIEELLMMLLEALSGGGGDVTAAAVLAAMEAMDSEQAEDALDAIGGEPAPATVTDLSSTSITLAASANAVYNYGELTSLTVSSFPASGEFSIVFVSGSTETVLTVPQTLIMPDGFAVEASTRYEINVKNGYAVVAGWAVSA